MRTRPLRARAPSGLIYGREGADYPHILESPPFRTRRAALAALDPEAARRFGGAMLVSQYRPSNGLTITTGAGLVAEILDARPSPHAPRRR